MGNSPNDGMGQAALRAIDREVRVRKILARPRSLGIIALLNALAAAMVFFGLADVQESMQIRIAATVACVLVLSGLLELLHINRRLSAAIELIKINENKQH